MAKKKSIRGTSGMSPAKRRLIAKRGQAGLRAKLEKLAEKAKQLKKDTTNGD